MIELNHLYIPVFRNKNFSAEFMIPLSVSNHGQITSLAIYIKNDKIFDIRTMHFLSEQWYSNNCWKL